MSSSLSSFFVWYSTSHENMARRVYSTSPLRAAKAFVDDPPYGVKESVDVNVRGINGLFLKVSANELKTKFGKRR